MKAKKAQQLAEQQSNPKLTTIAKQKIPPILKQFTEIKTLITFVKKTIMQQIAIDIPEITEMPYKAIKKGEIAVRSEIRELLSNKENGNRGGDYYHINPSLIDFLEGFNPREEIDYVHVDSLAVQIEQQGQIESCILLPKKDGRFFVIEGHHRTLAVAKIKERNPLIPGVKAILLPSDTTEVELVLITLMANVKKAFKPIEAARQFGILRKYGWTDTAISDTFGLSYQFVNGAMLLNEQAPIIQEAVKKGEISTTTVIALAREERDELKKVERFKAAQQKAAGGKIKAKDILESPNEKREARIKSHMEELATIIAIHASEYQAVEDFIRKIAK